MPRNEIRLAKSCEDRNAVYAFRYAVIVEELGFDLPTADHANKVIIDPEDASSHIFAAYKDGSVVGTVRANRLSEGMAEPHSTLLDLKTLENGTLDLASVTARLLVSPSLRGTPLAIRLAKRCYEYGLEKGVQRDYILIKPNLSSLYRRLGYSQISGNLVHPEIGEVVGMRLDCMNFGRLQFVSSILLR